MEKGNKNKAMKNADTKEGGEKGYFYPDYQITIQANSQAEADEKLKSLVDSKNQ